MKQFFAELKRRNVTRVALAYLAAAWFLVEVADTTFPRFGLSDAAVRNVIIVLAIGIIPAVVVSWFFELTPDGLKRDEDSDRTAESSPNKNKIADRLIVIMLLGAVGLLAVDRFILDPARDAAMVEEATEAAVADALLGAYGDKSIAVLAFDDMSPAGDQEYLSDGIAEELLNMLSPLSDLRVISRSSSFTFKGSDATVPEIAEKLGVAYILEGSVRKDGNRIRITAQLIDARTDSHIWSENYDRLLDNVFAIQDEISASIVEELKVTLLGEIPTSEKIDAYAYEMYLKAMYIVHTSNQEKLREAQLLLNEVLGIAPDYIPALNALGRLYYRIHKTEGMSAEENNAEIHRLAERVVEIDPEGISSMIWQGWFAYQAGDLQEAARFYENASAIDPNNTSLLRVLVSFLISISRPEEAVAVGRYLLLRDPACAVCVSNFAKALRAVGKPEESVAALETILTWHTPRSGFYWSLGVSLLHAGQPQRALDTFELEPLDGNREMGTIMALHDLGRLQEFEDRLAQFQEDSGYEGVARIYAWAGDADKAFEWLYRMVEMEGSFMLGLVDTDVYDKIKSDPRWRELRSRYGFEDIQPGSIEFNYSLPSGAKLPTQD